MIHQIAKTYTKCNNKYQALRRHIERKMMSASNIMRLDPDNPIQWSHCVFFAVERLLQGQVVAIPTDTLYGLVTLAEYSDKLYKLKRRNCNKPLGLFIDRPEEVKNYCVQTVPDDLLKTLFPGPVTLLFQRSARIPPEFNPGVSSIGIRIPQARFARDICRQLPYRLLAQTSANVSGSDRNPLRIQDFEELWDDIDLIIDGGPILENHGSRLGSTVLDLSDPGQFKLIRPGCAPEETVQLLREFGLRSMEEVARERLLEAGKEHRILQIEAKEVLDRDSI